MTINPEDTAPPPVVVPDLPELPAALSGDPPTFDDPAVQEAMARDDDEFLKRAMRINKQWEAELGAPPNSFLRFKAHPITATRLPAPQSTPGAVYMVADPDYPSPPGTVFRFTLTDPIEIHDPVLGTMGEDYFVAWLVNDTLVNTNVPYIDVAGPEIGTFTNEDGDSIGFFFVAVVVGNGEGISATTSGGQINHGPA